MEIKTNVITLVWDDKFHGHNLTHQEVFVGEWKGKFFEFLQDFVRSNKKGLLSAKVYHYDFNPDDLLTAMTWDDWAEKLPSIRRILEKATECDFEFRFNSTNCFIYLKQF